MANNNNQIKAERLRVQKYAELLAESGTVSIFEKKLKEIKGLKALKEADVTAVFQSVGIQVESTKNIESWLPSLIHDRELTLISDRLSLLKQQKDANGQVPQNIKTLYDFVAYISNDIANASIYINKRSSELLSIVEANIGKYVKATTDYAHAWTDLCSIAKNKIFDTEAHNKSYKDSLEYVLLKDELSEVVRVLTDDDKRLSSIADILISKICGKGYTQKEAIALYNRIANLIKNNPYIPEQSAIVIKCEKCSTLNRFSSLPEAEKSSCQQCKSALYTICPECSQKTPVTSDYCVHCNLLIAGIKNFNIYHQKALNALGMFDFVEARRQLANAKLANPKDMRMRALEKRIKDESAEFEKPICEIERLVNDKKLKSALRTVYDTKKKYSTLNLQTYETSLIKTIARLDKLFTDSKRLSQSKQIEACEQIIGECSDHDEALLFLKSIPPQPCGSITCQCDEQNVYINISWTPSSDKNVTYTLVRKEGGVPTNPSERNITKLATDTNQLSYSDSSVVSAQEYGYAVFVKRAEVFSGGKFATTILSQDVGGLNHISDNSDGVIISWDIPANCQRVRVYRRENSVPNIADKAATKVFDALSGSFNDKGLKTNCIYGYRIQAVYTTVSGEKVSQGLTFTHKIEEKLIPFTFDVSQRGLNITASWKGPKSGYSMRIVELNPNASITKGKIIKVSDIDRYGNTLVSVPSENGKATFTVAEYRCFGIIAFAYFSNDAIASNTETINTYLPITIASRKPRVDGHNLIFKLNEPIPESAKFICYGLKNTKPYWTEPSELNRRSKVSIESYRKRRNELFINNSQGLSDICYLTLYTEYAIDGRMVLSSPDKEKIKIPMQINVQYGVKVKNNRTALEFTINVKIIKGQITVLPPLNLVANGTNEIVASTEEISIRNGSGSSKNTITKLNLPKSGTRVRLLPEDESWLEDISFSPLNWFRGEI